MKKLSFIICFSAFFCCCNFLAFSQEVNNRKYNPDRPVFFSPKNHDPNFLKSGKLSEKSFYQSKPEWQHIIDTTWGPGDSLSRKLLIFNTYAQKIHDESDVLCKLNLSWDSLYNHYLSQIKESTSKGAFSAIMSHFAYYLKDRHTIAFDTTVVSSALNPGVPLLLLGSSHGIEHFGAVTTVLPDSTNLVLRVVPNHPLNLAPGDIILGYEGIPWKYLVKELFNAGLPVVATTGGCKSADTYENLCGAGLNWHLFSTIDILKYSTGDTVHLSVLPMLNLNVPPMVNNEQLAIQNIPFPHVLPSHYGLSDTVATYGILEDTNIGYIFLAMEWPTGSADTQFYEAINALKNTDALIIDMRLNFGGRAFFDKAFNILFNEFHKTVEHVLRCNTSTFEFCPEGNSALFQINGLNPDYYDRPIAVLLGPTCMSNGDWMAHRLRYHPMVRFFGASPGAALGWGMTIENIPGWILGYSGADMFHINDPGNYLNRKEFPIDYPVWFNKDDVAKGIDPVVEKSLGWINNLAYGHDITTENGIYSPVNDMVKINAVIENPNLHSLSTKLIFEKLDGTVVDSTEMFPVEITKSDPWQGKWPTKNIPEDMYWVSLKVTDITEGTTFTNKHITRITTVPLGLDKIINYALSTTYYSIQPSFKNFGISKTLTNLKIGFASNDPWIKSITPGKRNLSDIKPGQTRKTESITVKIDSTSFPNYFNLTFNVSSDGWSYWALDTTITVIPTRIESQKSLSMAFGLEQNYPNPFSTKTVISYRLPEPGDVELCVYDILGRKVTTLVKEKQPVGAHEFEWAANGLHAGIYFCKLKAGNFSQTRKMILMK